MFGLAYLREIIVFFFFFASFQHTTFENKNSLPQRVVPKYAAVCCKSKMNIPLF